MKPRLFWTFLFTFALVIGLSVCGMLGFVSLAAAGIWQPAAPSLLFEAQTAYVSSLGEYYANHGNSWTGVERRLSEPPFSDTTGFVRYVVIDAHGKVVASTDLRQVGQALPAPQINRGMPITVDGTKVGTFIVRGVPVSVAGEQIRRPPSFFWPVIRSFLIAGLALSSVLLLLAVLLARRLSLPLRDITQAAQQLAAGRLDVQVKRAPIHEIDQLTQAFNAMASSLSQADRQRRQMTADIAHELRTPLTIIKGRLEGIQDGVYSATSDQVERLLDETALLERLIEDLRLLALAEAGQLQLYREQLDPSDVLEHTRAAFADQANRQRVALRIEADDSLPSIIADPQRLAQVLANLVTNALRYTSAGGVITLAARAERLELIDAARLDDRGATVKTLQDAVVLQVIDTGQGIDASNLPYVFDRFYRADRSRARGSGGAGLGLAIAKQIVLAHGGIIWVESAVGQGTTFHIALPAQILAMTSTPAQVVINHRS